MRNYMYLLMIFIFHRSFSNDHFSQIINVNIKVAYLHVIGHPQLHYLHVPLLFFFCHLLIYIDLWKRSKNHYKCYPITTPIAIFEKKKNPPIAILGFDFHNNQATNKQYLVIFEYIHIYYIYVLVFKILVFKILLVA